MSLPRITPCRGVEEPSVAGRQASIAVGRTGEMRPARPPSNTISDHLTQVLMTRFPHRVMPRGAASEVARHAGVSRQLVHIVARGLGFSVVPLTSPRFGAVFGLCEECQSVIDDGASAFCRAHRWVTLACGHCGKRFERRRAQRILSGLDARYTSGGTRVFCSMRCSSRSRRGKIRASRGRGQRRERPEESG